MSERRACKAIGCCRMTMRYQTTRADEAGLRQRMRAIAQERRRFGYRRLHVLLKREGYLVNHKKLFRLYREPFEPTGLLGGCSGCHAGSSIRSRNLPAGVRPAIKALTSSRTPSSEHLEIGSAGQNIQ